jgi:hypothetical protein
MLRLHTGWGAMFHAGVIVDVLAERDVLERDAATAFVAGRHCPARPSTEGHWAHVRLSGERRNRGAPLEAAARIDDYRGVATCITGLEAQVRRGAATAEQ